MKVIMKVWLPFLKKTSWYEMRIVVQTLNLPDCLNSYKSRENQTPSLIPGHY